LTISNGDIPADIVAMVVTVPLGGGIPIEAPVVVTVTGTLNVNVPSEMST
jgi:hypothetical protein